MLSKRALTLSAVALCVVVALLAVTAPAFAAGKEKVLWAFCALGCKDGANPFGNLILDTAGNLYGTTSAGGDYGCGAVFELARVGKQWGFTVLYSFACGTDGALPSGGLLFDPGGNLYGTTLAGGGLAASICYNFFSQNGCGTVFQLTHRKGSWTKKTLYTFCATSSTCSDGAFPYASLTFDKTGSL
jgi:uncharacterized repeat protein (TIGR03803 family)